MNKWFIDVNFTNITYDSTWKVGYDCHFLCRCHL